MCDGLCDLVQFVQFKKLEKHPLRSVTFSNTPPLGFFTFFKLQKYQIAQSISCAYLIIKYQNDIEDILIKVYLGPCQVSMMEFFCKKA